MTDFVQACGPNASSPFTATDPFDSMPAVVDSEPVDMEAQRHGFEANRKSVIIFSTAHAKVMEFPGPVKLIDVNSKA